MKYLLSLLFVLFAITSNAQRYFLDSMGIQNGYNITNPKNLTQDDYYIYHFICDVNNSNTYKIMKHKSSGIHELKYSPTLPAPADYLNIATDSTYTYYTWYDNVKGYKLYKSPSLFIATTIDEINTNYPGTFTPLNGTYTDRPSSLIYMFNDSAGYLQLLIFNTRTQTFDSKTQLGKYKAVNTNFCKSDKLYFNMITDQDVELLYSCRQGISTPSLTIIDTISTNNTSARLTALFPLNESLYYAAYDNTTGYELVAYDTVNKKVKRLTDLAPGKKDGIYSDHISATFGAYADPQTHDIMLLFNGSSSPDTLGYQLYAYNTSYGTTKLIHNLTSTPLNGKINAGCTNFVSPLAELRSSYRIYYYPSTFFSAYADTQRVLWEYNGIDTPTIVSVQGVDRIANPGKIVFEYTSAWLFSSTKNSDATLLFHFTGNNGGVSKIYKLIDRALDLSVDQLSAVTATTVYPNPVTQDAHINITLKSAENIAVQLTDMNGRIVYYQPQKIYSSGSHTIDLPMQALPAGMYIYKLTGGDSMMLHKGKILKQ